jgi:hypothetical protein
LSIRRRAATASPGEGLVDACIVAEEMGRLVSPGPLIGANVVAAALSEAANAADHAEVIAALMAGAAVASWAVYEPRRGCDISYTSAQDTASLLTTENTALLNAPKAKIGLNPQTPGVLTGYFNLLAIKWAIEKANSLDGTKLAATLSAASSVPTNIAGLNLNWTATPGVHNGFPASSLKECDLKQGPFDILFAAS